MPKNIKSHAKWKEARKEVRETYGSPGEKVPQSRYFAIVNTVYQKMGGKFTHKYTHKGGK